MRILVTGSRDWTDIHTIRSSLLSVKDNFSGWHSDPSLNVMVSGACPDGADYLCELEGERLGMTIERHPADWKNLGKKAGFVRNSYMVSLGADICLAFIMPCVKEACADKPLHGSHGAIMTARLAMAKDITTWKRTKEGVLL